MKNILHLDTSPLVSASVSRQLTAAVVERMITVNPHATVKHRDLIATPVAHLGGELLQAWAPGSATSQSETVRSDLALTEELLLEFLEADVVVIGAPMLNFSIPSQLKSWIDRVVRAGRTFRYDASGPVGLAAGKQAIIVLSRGGIYAGTPAEVVLDHQEPYLRAILNFLGVTDVTFVRAEGVALSPEKKEEALANARLTISTLAATPAAAA
jgi:FMN-dependent NADH-azoreductase